jgi:hypothetical protein
MVRPSGVVAMRSGTDAAGGVVLALVPERWLGAPVPALFERFTDLGVRFEVEKNSFAQLGH